MRFGSIPDGLEKDMAARSSQCYHDSIQEELQVAQILVRDIEDDVKERLQRRAARHGHSMEAEVRDILRDVVKQEDRPGSGLGTEIAALFHGIGLTKDEDIPELRSFHIESPFEK